MTPEQIISELPCDKRAVLIAYLADIQAGTRSQETKRCANAVRALKPGTCNDIIFEGIAVEIEKDPDAQD